MDDFGKRKPVCIMASGIKGVGRTTLIKKCIYKSNIRKNTYPFSKIILNSDESIEDFVLKLYDLGLVEKTDMSGFMTKSIDEKVKTALDIIRCLQSLEEIIFIEDNGCIINHEGELTRWFSSVLSDNELQDKVTLCLVSKFRLVYFGEEVTYAIKQRIFTLEVDELSKKERDGLLNRYLNFENINLSLEDMKLLSGLLVGFPEQVFFAVTLIREKGIEYVRRHTEEVVEFNNKKASIMLKEYEDDEEKIAFLALLSAFDYIGNKFVFDIVGEKEIYNKYIGEFIASGICEYVGAMREYIRVNETIKDYVVRNNYSIKEKHKMRLREHLDIILNNLSMDEYDVPEFLFSLKEAMLSGRNVDDKYLIPSLYLKTMTDLYNKRKNKDVVVFADKALENEEYMDDRMIFEIRYLLCSALAKQRDKRFLEEVHKIQGADFDFLFAFYYRQIGKYDKALQLINSSMQKRKNFSKAKREKVQIYIGMQEFQTAKELARENYLNYKENPYHIQAYFSCLIKSEKNKENREILTALINTLDLINSDVAREMSLRCKAQFEAFYNDSEEQSIAYINQAIDMNPNIQYARIVKFDICDRFNLMDDMKDILKFFRQPEYSTKYHNNIVCFESIIMAKEGEIGKAVEYYTANIRNYTDEAKDKFVIKLNKYDILNS